MKTILSVTATLAALALVTGCDPTRNDADGYAMFTISASQGGNQKGTGLVLDAEGRAVYSAAGISPTPIVGGHTSMDFRNGQDFSSSLEIELQGMPTVASYAAKGSFELEAGQVLVSYDEVDNDSSRGFMATSGSVRITGIGTSFIDLEFDALHMEKKTIGAFAADNMATGSFTITGTARITIVKPASPG
jgi:hypothetical protein